MVIEEKDRILLLKMARAALTQGLKKTDFIPTGLPAGSALLEHCGAFVSVYVKGALRGCLGAIESERTLADTISRLAVEAATQDSRFESVRVDELDALKIEISVLTPLEEIHGPQDVRIGRDGLVVRKGFASGLLLPQVATRYKFSSEEFLRQVCLKARLPQDGWQKGARIFRFQAEVFSEN